MLSELTQPPLWLLSLSAQKGVKIAIEGKPRADIARRLTDVRTRPQSVMAGRSDTLAALAAIDYALVIFSSC